MLNRNTGLKRSTELRARTPMPRVRMAKREKGLAHKLAATLDFLRPIGAQKRRADDEKAYLDACRGEPCYLSIPGTCRRDIATVVACHSNELAHGKGRGIKALNVYTVPGCFHCHAELDQGRIFNKEEKRAIWRDAYGRWAPVRGQKMEGRT